jgi:hypothetical protein
LSRRIKDGDIERIETSEGMRYRCVSRSQHTSCSDPYEGEEVRAWDFDFEVGSCEPNVSGALDFFQALPDDDDAQANEREPLTFIGIFGGLSFG